MIFADLDNLYFKTYAKIFLIINLIELQAILGLNNWMDLDSPKIPKALASKRSWARGS